MHLKSQMHLIARKSKAELQTQETGQAVSVKRVDSLGQELGLLLFCGLLLWYLMCAV